ncbi:MAG: citrate (Si)-synthase [Acidobacteriota bacterium]
MTDEKKLLAEDFVLTDDHLDGGLRGIPVGTCRTSAVSADEGVSYRGYPITDLADLSCEDVIYLLFHGELPSGDQAKSFSEDLGRRSEVDPAVFDLVARLPESGHPMEALIAAVMFLGMTGKTEDNDYREDALNLVARSSAVVAAVFRVKNGWGDPIAPRTDLPFHENFAHMMGCPGGHEVLADLLRMFYVLHADHGGGNLSTFVGKAVASGLADTYSSMAGALAALYGPRHGRANQECLEFVKRIGTFDPAEAESRVRAVMADGGVVYGYGHAVLRAEDPRATIQFAFGEKHFADDENFKIARTLRQVVPSILKEHPKISNPYPNVDAVSGSLLHAAGLKDSRFYTLLFGWSRIAGISAQIVDEREVLRGGKGVPIYRPRFIAVDQPRRRR